MLAALGAAGAFTAGSNVISTLLNNSAQKKMNQQNFDNQVELWKMQNEYNKPENQMKRLQAAGLNPNLVYGSGATTTAGSVGYTPGVAPTFGGIADAFSNYMNYAGQREERLLRKQAIDNAKLKDDAMTEIAQTEAGIKKEQLKEARLTNSIIRQKELQNMDINSTKIKNEQEVHNLGMEVKKNEEKFNKWTRWPRFIVDSVSKLGDTASKFFMPRFIFKK